MRHTIFCALLLLAAASCKKKESTTTESEWDSGPTCPVGNALLEREEYTYKSGMVRNYRYTYDAQHRVVEEYQNDTLMAITSYPIPGKAVTERISYETTSDRYYEIETFSANAEHLNRRYLSVNKTTHDTDVITYEMGTYDAAHQMIYYIYYSLTDTWGGGTDTNYMQRYSYEWQDGNMVQKNDLLTGKPLLYTFEPGTNGQFTQNVPFYCARFMYYTAQRPVVSKNLYSSETYDGATTTNTYTFDQSGRVAGVEQSNGARRRLKYRCY